VEGRRWARLEQAEDEIAALNMAIGASYRGADDGGHLRRRVRPDGGSASLAGMLEAPVVIALGMPPGPATGMPTRTDRRISPSSLSAGHGDSPALCFPRFGRGGVRTAHHAIGDVGGVQVPCILLTDQYSPTPVDTDPGIPHSP